MATHEGSFVDGVPVPFKDQYPKFAAEELPARYGSLPKVLPSQSFSKSST